LVSLVQMGLAPPWMVVVILGREFFVTVLRSVILSRGESLPASTVGKVKMVAQVIAILGLILGRAGWPGFTTSGQIALWVATVAAIVSAADYSRRLNWLLAGRPTPAAPVVRTPAVAPERSRARDQISA